MAARRPDATGADDLLLPFETVASRAKGGLVRLGASLDSILTRHAYPEPVASVLAEALVVAALLTRNLPLDGRLILQTESDGAVRRLVADATGKGALRGYASFAVQRVEDAMASGGGGLIGRGHLALTIDRGDGSDRRQGIVALEGGTLTDAAAAYFRDSEQLPSLLKLAVARAYVPGSDEPDGARTWRWRAGGLIFQHLEAQLGETDTPAAEDWQRAAFLAGTVEDHELTDPTLAPERLLYRLFHEEGVRVFETRHLTDTCRCSAERVTEVLKSFGRDALADMVEADGKIAAKCEFCARVYRIEPDAIG